MTTITKYQCDICKEKYDTKKQALHCESKGNFDPKDYPPGLMFEYHHHGFVGIFSIPAKVEQENNKHYGHTSYWACRVPTLPGDSLGKELCGGDYLYSGEGKFKEWVGYNFIDKHLNSPEFDRMVKYLKSKGITPTYYNKKGQLITIK